MYNLLNILGLGFGAAESEVKMKYQTVSLFIIQTDGTQSEAPLGTYTPSINCNAFSNLTIVTLLSALPFAATLSSAASI